MEGQTWCVEQLNALVSATPEFRRAQANNQLIQLLSGDGMALVYFGDPEAPARCALGLARSLRHVPQLQLRMGVHSGPVYRMKDIRGAENVTGGGVNIAQRVMDAGDTNHILLSRSVADILGQLNFWEPLLHDIGECEVKHGVRVHLFNLYREADGIGNPELPAKMRAQRATPAVSSPSAPVTESDMPPPGLFKSRPAIEIAAPGLPPTVPLRGREKRKSVPSPQGRCPLGGSARGLEPRL